MPQSKKHPTHAARQAAYRDRCELARRAQLTERALPALPPISSFPGTARWNAAIRRASELLETIRAEMESYHDDRSTEWQESERGDEHQERIAQVEAALDAVSELLQ